MRISELLVEPLKFTLKLTRSGEGITTDAADTLPLESTQALGKKPTKTVKVFEVCSADMIVFEDSCDETVAAIRRTRCSRSSSIHFASQRDRVTRENKECTSFYYHLF
jgi:hypothetical protein